MLARTVFHGNNAKCWNTMPRSGPGAVTGLPSTVIGARLDRQEAAKEIEESGFAAAGGAEQGQKFPCSDLQRNVVERQHRLAARRPVRVTNPFDDDLRTAHYGSRASPFGIAVWRGSFGLSMISLRAVAPAPRECFVRASEDYGKNGGIE